MPQMPAKPMILSSGSCKYSNKSSDFITIKVLFLPTELLTAMKRGLNCMQSVSIRAVSALPVEGPLDFPFIWTSIWLQTGMSHLRRCRQLVKLYSVSRRRMKYDYGASIE